MPRINGGARPWIQIEASPCAPPRAIRERRHADQYTLPKHHEPSSARRRDTPTRWRTVRYRSRLLPDVRYPPVALPAPGRRANGESPSTGHDPRRLRAHNTARPGGQRKTSPTAHTPPCAAWHRHRPEGCAPQHGVGSAIPSPRVRQRGPGNRTVLPVGHRRRDRDWPFLRPLERSGDA